MDPNNMGMSFSRIVGSQSVAHEPQSMTLSWGLRGQNYFENKIWVLFVYLFYCVDICTHGAGAVLGKPVLLPKSKQWHQIVLVVIIFFSSTWSQGKNEQLYVRMFLMKQVMKLLILWNPICIFWIPEWWNGTLIRELRLHTKVWWLPRGKTHVWFFELGTAAVFVGYCFYLKEWLTHDGYSDLDIWQTFSEQWTKRACHFKYNNWWYLLLMIILEFWKTCISHCELESFLILRLFGWD